jgi:hypothetical protein
MSRLITFGDSFTYGHGLADCHVEGKNWAGPTPSKFAWSQVLGDKLGLEVINQSKPGHSNIQILRDILSFDFVPTDLVVVGWTYAVRDYIFKKNFLGMDVSFMVSPWSKDKSVLKKYLSVHNDYDLSIRAGLYIHHSECFLKTKNVKQYHFCAHHGWVQVMPDFINTPTNFIPYMILDRDLDLALDNSHPGPVAHKLAAEKLYEIINESK